MTDETKDAAREPVAKQMRHRYEASLWSAWYEWTPEKDAWAAGERETYGTLIVETRDLYTTPTPEAGTVTEAMVEAGVLEMERLGKSVGGYGSDEEYAERCARMRPWTTERVRAILTAALAVQDGTP